MERNIVRLKQVPVSIVSRKEQSAFGSAVLLILFAVGVAFCLVGQCSERGGAPSGSEHGMSSE